MFYSPPKYEKTIIDINKEIAAIQGEMDDKTAKITFAKFLRRNIGFATELLTGVKLAPYQIITIKGLLARNYSMCVWGRGVGKTFGAAIYCILQCVFEPNTNILIAGPTFRTARFIFNHIEKIVDSKEAKLLFDCMGVKSKRNDEYKWTINGGSIVAIPLNGEKIRGFRANVLVIDEFLLMSEEIVERVLMPYLVAPQDIKDRLKIRAREDVLIKNGLMQEHQRVSFENRAKLIALSSASYKCEFLYRKYEEFLKSIYDPKPSENGVTHFISQLAWNAIPPEMVDKSVIEVAQSNEANMATFKREYGAEFIDGSDGYFSMNKMIDCTVKDGEDPTLLLRGDKAKKYILAIDPNFSNSITADHFAMCVVELDEDLKGGTIVHQYAQAGKDLKDHIKYFYYLLTNFNVEMIIIDYAGYQFIEAANENEMFRKIGMELKIFEFSAEKDGAELEEELKQARRNFNRQMQRIVFTQYFTTDFIRKGNEWLQGCIDYKKIWFGGLIKANPEAFEKATHTQLNVPSIIDCEHLSDETPLGWFIDAQEVLIRQTKYQCASIEVKTTAKGVQTFDLPQLMKRDTNENRMRRDSYTALMLACWGMKAYHDIMNVPEEQFETFTPFFV
jgi:hypothetical protein